MAHFCADLAIDKNHSIFQHAGENIKTALALGRLLNNHGY